MKTTPTPIERAAEDRRWVEIRNGYATDEATGTFYPDVAEEADRWLTAHDARLASEAAERALRGFADTWRRGDSNPWALHVKTVVKRRADRLANEREGR